MIKKYRTLLSSRKIAAQRIVRLRKDLEREMKRVELIDKQIKEIDASIPRSTAGGGNYKKAL